VDRATGRPCRDATRAVQVFRATIELVADGLTVVDTRNVTIIARRRGSVGRDPEPAGIAIARRSKWCTISHLVWDEV